MINTRRSFFGILLTPLVLTLFPGKCWKASVVDGDIGYFFPDAVSDVHINKELADITLSYYAPQYNSMQFMNYKGIYSIDHD